MSTATVRRTVSPRFTAALPHFVDGFDASDPYGSTSSALFGLCAVLHCSGRNHDAAREFLAEQEYRPGATMTQQTIADLVREVGAARAAWTAPDPHFYDYDVFDYDTIAIGEPVVDALPGAERAAALDGVIYAGRVLSRYAEWLERHGLTY